MRPRPKKGESFIGYLVRLTEMNAYDTPSWILSLAGIDYMELQWTFAFVFGETNRLDKLAQLTNNTLDDLKALVYSPANSSQGKTAEHEFNFYGASLNRSIIRPHHPKICPKCLAEFGYCLRIWDCSLVTACPTHECMLLESCPKCRRQIRAIRKSVSICACGCDWRDVDPQLLTVDELAASRRIYQLCGLLSNTPKEENENPLHGLGLRDFVVALTFIAGLFRKMAWARGRPSKSIKLRNEELHQLYNQAYSVFENWPDSFHQFLRAQSRGQVRLNPHDGKLDTSLKKEFGSLYECLYNDLEGSQSDFMREVFVQFLNERMYSHLLTSNSSPSLSTESVRYISLRDARRNLKITNRALFDLVEAGTIEWAITNGRRTPEFAVSAVDVERLKREFEESITCRDLAKELGADYETIRELAKKGLVEPRARRSTDGFNTLRFGRRAAEKFLQSASGQSFHTGSAGCARP